MTYPRYTKQQSPKSVSKTYTEAKFLPIKAKDSVHTEDIGLDLFSPLPVFFKAPEISNPFSNPNFNFDKFLASFRSFGNTSTVSQKLSQPVNISLLPQKGKEPASNSSDDYYYYDYDVPDKLNSSTNGFNDDKEYYDDDLHLSPPSKSILYPTEVRYSAKYRDKPVKVTSRTTTQSPQNASTTSRTQTTSTTTRPGRGHTQGRQKHITTTTTTTPTNRLKIAKKTTHRPKTR